MNLRDAFDQVALPPELVRDAAAAVRRRRGRRRTQQLAAVACVASLTVSGGWLVTRSDHSPTQNDQSVSNLTPTTGERGVMTPGPIASSSPTQQLTVPPNLKARTGAHLLVIRGTHVSELDVDRHRVSDRDARVVGSALDCQTFVAQVVQSSVFLLCDNNTGAGSGPGPVFLANRDFTSIREVGTAAYLARSGHADRVWASTITDGPDRVTTSLAELDLDGDVRSRFQADSYVTPAKEGFIHEDGKDLVLTDRVGSVTRRILSADVVDVQGDILVYDREVDDNIPCGDCGLHVYDMARHTDRRFGGLAVGALGRLSESGGVLIAASDEGMAVCSITSLMCAPVPGAGAGGYYGLTGTFASDEQWFFFVDPDRVSIDALDLRSGRVFRAFSGIDDSDRLPARSLPGTEISGLGSF